jgi:hypothetical protein
MGVDYEIVCLDENGGISRAMQGRYSGVNTAVVAAAARAPEDCSRIMLCAIKTSSLVWAGSREDALEAAAATKKAARKSS